MNTLKTTQIHPNKGNPRYIKDKAFKRLVRSLKDFPEMLEARPIVINPDNMVLGGNMRLAACKEAGIKEVPVYRASWDEIKQKQFVITDNISYGEWDWDILGNDWDELPLNDWGLDVFKPAEVDYSILDSEDFGTKLDQMEGDVRRAIQIPFESEDYDEAKELYKHWADSGAYVGGMILELLRKEK
tara:strand:- start:3712 stop:4269 length:558 start_codon:yes stop_codon:yes gene_type:complete